MEAEPLFWETVRAFYEPHGRHHWRDVKTEEITLGDHSDEDGDGIADDAYEVCDERPRDHDGSLLTGLPEGEG